MLRLLLCLTVAIGCGGRVVETTPSDAAVVDSAAPPSTEASPPIDEDAITPSPVDSAPPVMYLTECFGDMGKSNTSTLKDLLYDWAACPSTDGSCLRKFRFNVGCAMELQRGDMSSVRGATANDADCQLLRRWSTSERLLKALDPVSAAAKACAAAPEPARLYESTLVGGTIYELKTYFCEVEPFVTHRRCLQRVIEKYFPSK